MKYLLVLLMCASAQADIKVENGEVLPFSLENYPLKQFVQDYAELNGINVSHVNDLIREEKVYLKLNTKLSKEDFKKTFYDVLDQHGITAIEDDGMIWLDPSRDIRYLLSNVYTDDSYPKDASYSTVIHKLKYPVSSEIARNLRPFMSRYGRVIDFSDARTILLHDKGDNISRLLDTIKHMDTEKAYQSVLNYVPRPDPDAGHPLKEKIVELEAEKKILEKKYMELKESQSVGGIIR